jgi:hypothetical protein
MRKEKRKHEIEVDGKKYIFLTNVGQDTEHYRGYLTQKESGEDIIIQSPARQNNGTPMFDAVAIYIPEEKYRQFVEETLLDLESIKNLQDGLK